MCIRDRRKAVGADVNFEAVAGGPERFNGVLVVVGGGSLAVVDLNERVRPAAPEDAGDEGQAMARGGVDDLEVPALEERRPLTMQPPMIARRVQRVANESNHALSKEGNHRLHSFHRLGLLICEICVICGFFLLSGCLAFKQGGKIERRRFGLAGQRDVGPGQ